MKKYNIAVVGATGVVGSTFLKVLEEYKLPIKELFLFASSKSAGKIINFEGKFSKSRVSCKKNSFKGIPQDRLLANMITRATSPTNKATPKELSFHYRLHWKQWGR